MIAEVADALDHAHENGVIHRDIKPANLLLSPDGRLSVSDFGLARMLEQPGMTLSGEFVGSPLYMSPEQITAGRVPLDHRTDIYSLGATLYELLTFEPPFPGTSRDEVLANIIQKEPVPPRRHNRKISVDLETICLKAMERDPGRRYASAAEFAADLRRLLRSEPLMARPQWIVTKLARRAARHKVTVSLGAGLVVVLVAAGIVAHWYRGEYAALEREQWARVEALPEAKRLFDEGRYLGAFNLTVLTNEKICCVTSHDSIDLAPPDVPGCSSDHQVPNSMLSLT